MKIYKFKINTN